MFFYIEKMGCSKGRAHLSLFAKRGSSTLIHVLHASQRKKQNASYWEGRLPGARGGCCWWLAWLRRRPCCSQCCCCWSRWLLHKLLKPGLPLLRRVLRIRRLYMWDEWNVFYVGTRAFYEHIQKLQCCRLVAVSSEGVAEPDVFCKSYISSIN